MRVCFWGTFDRDYSRHQILAKGLAENGVELLYCHEAVWQKSADKTKAYKGAFGKLVLAFQLAFAYLKLTLRYLFMPRHDIILVGFLGHFDMFLARFLASLFGRKLVFDVFISLYDTSVHDRALTKDGGFWARSLKRLDRLSVRLADLVLLDTPEHIDYFVEALSCRRESFLCLPVGANDTIYSSELKSESSSNEKRVLLYCRYAPLHGVEAVLQAARILKDEGDLKFRLIGDGQTRIEMESMVKDWSLNNVEFIDSIAEDKLAREIAAADIHLGIFGATGKAKRVVPNKLYQGMALGKAMITGRSSAVESILKDRESVVFCEMANALSLAESIKELLSDSELRRKLEENSRQLFLTRFTPEILGGQLKTALSDLSNH
ncbi:MAG: glycosyltransferase [Planctomycetota bacterium]|nr:glycosyltransferase [Planctomycetota bacterium]